jgi:TPP-dependent indolepyruvate ferredoxin oxidoreductase alpha subunit
MTVPGPAPAALFCEGCGAEITDLESGRGARWLAAAPPRPPLLCWVCAHLAAGNARESAELALYMKDEATP